MSSTVSKAITDAVTVLPKPPSLVLTAGYSGQVHPGEAMTFTHTLTNTGGNPDSFNLTATPDLSGWTATISPSIVGPLNAGQHAQMSVTVQVPDDASSNTMGTVLVAATSQMSDTVFCSVTDTLMVALPTQSSETLYLPLILHAFE